MNVKPQNFKQAILIAKTKFDSSILLLCGSMNASYLTRMDLKIHFWNLWVEFVSQ